MVMTIQQKREAMGLSQANLAVQMGVARSAVANWETEVALPRTRQLPDLARVFGCTIDELYTPEARSPMQAFYPKEG